MTERSGVLLHRKPAGVTSHDVVARVRRGLPRGTKVGHAGTLDPFATVLLLVLVGRATRAQRFLMELPKTYRVVARLGWVSDTGDRDGELQPTGRAPQRLELPTGELMQRPPAYSAVRVGGRRAYELERTAIGRFRLEDADPERLVPLAEALAFLPERRLTGEEADDVRHGRRVTGATGSTGPLRLTRDGELLAVGEERGRELRPVVVFASG